MNRQTRQELHVLGCRLRAMGSTRGDWLTYIDGTLPLLTMMPQVVVAPTAELPKLDLKECPVCAENRRRKAKAQKNWRKKAKREERK